MLLIEKVYKLSSTFPSNENYGLVSQIRRAAVSIPSNIAWRLQSNSNKDFQHFLSIALGSAFELETQLILSFELNYLTDDDLNNISSDLIPLQKND